MSGKRVLIVCYYFPPLGGAGVGRPVALYRHLPEFGWEGHVLTVKPVAYRTFEPELLAGLPTEHIYRAGSMDPQRLLYLLGVRTVPDRSIQRGRVVSKRFFPDSKVGWVRPAVRLGRALLSNRQYRAIVSTSPPISCHLAACRLARELSLPWIADFRDYWTAYKIDESYHRPRQVARGRQLKKRIRETAAVITAINESVGAYAEADAIIYNSVDRDLSRRWRLPSDHRCFRIGVLGTLNDIYPIQPLLMVLSALRQTRPDLFARIQILQVGAADSTWLTPQLDRYDLTSVFHLAGWRPRRETIDLLSETSLMYIGLPSVRESGFSTGRIYTMLSSGRPVLAAVPPGGEIARLIDSTGHGYCFFTGEEGQAADYVANLTANQAQGRSDIRLQPAYAQPFTSDTMAGRFVDLFSKL